MTRHGWVAGRVGIALAVGLGLVAGCGSRVRTLGDDPATGEGEGSAGGSGSGMLPGTPPRDGSGVAGGASGGGVGGSEPGGIDSPPVSAECSGEFPTVCKVCPDGSCANPVCLNGLWELQCAGDPAAPGGCPDALPQLCRTCPDGTCGEPFCVGGAWQFECKDPRPVPSPCAPCGAVEPVCGFDGITYNAACGAHCIPVEIACRGQCPCAMSDPCANRRCGELCDPCGGVPGCVAPAVLTFCDEKLQCTSRVPVCEMQPACMVMGDCPAVELCLPCPDGRCAEQACLNYVCQFVCPL